MIVSTPLMLQHSRYIIHSFIDRRRTTRYNAIDLTHICDSTLSEAERRGEYESQSFKSSIIPSCQTYLMCTLSSFPLKAKGTRSKYSKATGEPVSFPISKVSAPVNTPGTLFSTTTSCQLLLEGALPAEEDSDLSRRNDKFPGCC